MTEPGRRLPAALAAACIAAACGLALSPGPSSPVALARFEYFKIQMGTRVRIVLYAGDEARARAAAVRAFERIEALERIMTDYDPASELMSLGREARRAPRRVSPDLFAILDRAALYARLSKGAFDVTVGPLVALWREARRTGEPPQPALLAQARSAVGRGNVVLDRRARTVRLRRPGMKLDLGGIAKGYAADEALGVLAALGIERALVAAGGDIALGSPPPGEPGWRIAVQNPGLPGDQAVPDLILASCGVSTSGDAEQFVEIAGRRYSHIVDPRSGRALERSASVTVVAPDDTAADALATALSVLAPEQGIALADSIDGVSAFVVVRRAGALVSYASRRMAARLPAKTPQ